MSLRPDTAELAGELRPAVMRLGRRLRQMRDDSVEVTASSASVLGTLAGAGELTMGDLAAAEKVQPPTVTRVVKGLEERGLVQRRPDPSDGRQSLARLTEAGHALVLTNRHLRNAWLSERLAELDPAEQELLRRAVPVLNKVNHA